MAEEEVQMITLWSQRSKHSRRHLILIHLEMSIKPLLRLQRRKSGHSEALRLSVGLELASLRLLKLMQAIIRLRRERQLRTLTLALNQACKWDNRRNLHRAT